MTISPAFAPGPSNAQRERRLPLSSAQLRLWLLDQIDAGVQDAYHISGALEFRGRLDEEALTRAECGIATPFGSPVEPEV